MAWRNGPAGRCGSPAARRAGVGGRRGVESVRLKPTMTTAATTTFSGRRSPVSVRLSSIAGVTCTSVRVSRCTADQRRRNSGEQEGNWLNLYRLVNRLTAAMTNENDINNKNSPTYDRPMSQRSGPRDVLLCLADWAEWSAWTSCSTAVTCGRGARTRSRVCESAGCTPGRANESRVCHSPLCDGTNRALGADEGWRGRAGFGGGCEGKRSNDDGRCTYTILCRSTRIALILRYCRQT